MYVQLWPIARPCTLIVVPTRVLFPQEENHSARFAKAVTSSYLVDVSPRTQSFARGVGLVGSLGLGRADVCMDSSRLYSSSTSTSNPARSPTCVALSLKCLPRVASSFRGTATRKGLQVCHRTPFLPTRKYCKPQWVGSGLLRFLDAVWGGFPVGSR